MKHGINLRELTVTPAMTHFLNNHRPALPLVSSEIILEMLRAGFRVRCAGTSTTKYPHQATVPNPLIGQ